MMNSKVYSAKFLSDLIFIRLKFLPDVLPRVPPPPPPHPSSTVRALYFLNLYCIFYGLVLFITGLYGSTPESLYGEASCDGNYY